MNVSIRKSALSTGWPRKTPQNTHETQGIYFAKFVVVSFFMFIRTHS